MTSIKIDKMTVEQFGEALRREAIAKQNDAFRKMILLDESVGRWVVTRAVYAEGPAFVAACILAVRKFEDFTEEMDPYGERSMGRLEPEGKTVWFKIDLYDVDYEGGSDDPSEVTKTRRVLTILFPSDY